MNETWDLLTDNATVPGRLVTSVALLIGAWLLGAVAGALVVKRRRDPFDRFVAHKIVRYVAVAAFLIALAVLWRPFAGRLGVVLGFITAGLAFAMQEVIGALAGWISIATGHLYRVGDRVDVGGVRGDIIDVTPLRTTLMEMGSPATNGSWVGGRQLTGRIVSVSNKTVFTAPVFNYSASFDFLWEELMVPVPYDADWHRAEAILTDAVREASDNEEAQRAVEAMRRSYPIPPTDLEPRVYVRLTDNWVELAARFVVPVRRARAVKDGISRKLLHELQSAGIEVASATTVVTLRQPHGDGDDVTPSAR